MNKTTPKRWQRKQLKRRVVFSYGESLSAENRHKGKITVFGSNGQIGTHNQFITKGESIIIGRKGSSGKITWSNNKCFPIDTTFYVDKTTTHENLRWVYYLLIDMELDKINLDSAVPGLNREQAHQSYVNFPSLSEQYRIATYLDKTCTIIDKAIEAKQKQLEILDALRKSIIHKAITRGLDDSVELKDSGVEWLGRIPKHWKVRRIKDIVTLNSGDSITSGSITPGGNYPVFGGNGLRGFTTSYTHDGYYVLIGRQGALCGNINYAEGKFWASEHAVVASMLTKHDTFWLGELLRVMNLNQYSNAAAQPGLAVEKIKFLRLPVPLYEEQHCIASFIRGKIVKNEALVSNLQKQISTLKQYRKSLIHECVTGKRRVTDDDVQGQL